MELVLDATPLIYLARSGGLRILKDLKTRIFVPRAVYEEVVVAGRRHGKPGADLIDSYVKQGVITVRDSSRRIGISDVGAGSVQDLERPLGRGEAGVLSLAQELGCTAVIDEHVGRSIARLHGITVHGTVYLLVLGFEARSMTKTETISTFKRMVAEGWRISVEDYTSILEELEKL